MQVLSLVVGGVWGAFTLLLMLNNAALRTKLLNATKVGTDALEKASKYEANLEEARSFFEQQLKRPSAAFFNDAQVESLATRLVQLLFVPVAQAVKRELSKKEQ